MDKAEFFFSASPDESFRLAQILGELIAAPLRIALLGELGAGKTLFVQGLAKGFAVPDTVYVTSPSYALIHEYPGRLPLYHADLYRLSGEDELAEIGFFEILHSPSLCVVEWAERMENMDEFDLLISIEILAPMERKITMKACGLGAEDLLMSLRQKWEKTSGLYPEPHKGQVP